MAAPTEINLQNLSGKWTMNKSLSDSQDAFLTLQGIGWLTRSAIYYATVTLELKEYKDEEGVTHIDITSTASGLSTSQENRVLDWNERDHQDKLFGNVKGRSHFITKEKYEPAVDGVTDEEKKYMLAEELKDGASSTFLGDDLVQSVAVNQDEGYGWGVDQLWGFEEVNGERRHTRRLICKNNGKTQMMRLVYDYNGPLDS